MSSRKKSKYKFILNFENIVFFINFIYMDLLDILHNVITSKSVV